jgi:16S rRNA (guanine(1405)-N(7))-methyltransferase
VRKVVSSLPGSPAHGGSGAERLGVSEAFAVDAVQRIVEEVLASRRYRWLAPEFVSRVAAREGRHVRRHADAVKATKARLHQVYGAYVQELASDDMVRAVDDAREKGPAAVRDTCRRLMAEHASTRERLPILERYYVELFALTGPPRSVVDLACGLGALALPWMELPEGATYTAYDVDRRYVEIGAAALRACGVPGRMALRDVVTSPPEEAVDVALLLKAAPCLEQQGPGSARRVLEGVRSRHVAVSFPTQSLGGAGKGMVAHYRQLMAALIEGTPWAVRELLYPQELVCIVTKPAGVYGDGPDAAAAGCRVSGADTGPGGGGGAADD